MWRISYFGNGLPLAFTGGGQLVCCRRHIPAIYVPFKSSNAISVPLRRMLGLGMVLGGDRLPLAMGVTILSLGHHRSFEATAYAQRRVSTLRTTTTTYNQQWVCFRRKISEWSSFGRIRVV